MFSISAGTAGPKIFNFLGNPWEPRLQYRRVIKKHKIQTMSNQFKWELSFAKKERVHNLSVNLNRWGSAAISW